MKKQLIIPLSLFIIFLLLYLIQVRVSYTFNTPPLVITDTTGTPIIGEKTQTYTTFDEIPPELIELLIHHEDQRFWEHNGIDFKALLRAGWVWLHTRQMQGASTIDQQVIKIDQQAYTRTWQQKIHEMRRATTLQHHLSKQDILLRYVNTMPFSHGITGRRSACELYRAQSCSTLDSRKLLLLYVASKESRSLRNDDYYDRLATKAHLLDPETTYTIFYDLLLYTVHIPSDSLLDPRTADILEITSSSGTYNTELSNAIDAHLDLLASQRQTYAIQNCCVVVMSATGDILSMNFCNERGDDYGSMINTCTSPRQTGSAAKPFLYTLAMHDLGYAAQTTITDAYVAYPLGDGAVYTPQNFDLKYHGEVSLAYALGNSLNIPAVKLVDQLGVAHYLTFLKQLVQQYAPTEQLNKKTAENVGLSVALGTYEMSPLGFVQMRRFFLDTDSPYRAQTRIVKDILENPLHKVASFGQDSFLYTPGWAVKTGTSRKFIDARVCGVHEELAIAACIWMGNINNKAMQGPSSEVASFTWHLVTESVERFYK